MRSVPTATAGSRPSASAPCRCGASRTPRSRRAKPSAVRPPRLEPRPSKPRLQPATVAIRRACRFQRPGVLAALASATAELARRLRVAADAGAPLVVDGFCDHLDPLSAACCAASLGRHLRRDGARTRALLACCHARVAHWLRPDAVLVCRAGARPVALRLREPLGGVPLRID
eukprot:1119092-Prymnesium_polylepis.1